jgi:hypothetical protein
VGACGSIKKWETIVAGTGVDEGPRNYACSSCPIAIYVNKWGCEGTPYVEWNYYVNLVEKLAKAFNTDVDEGRGAVFDKKSKRLAQTELDFLLEVKAHFESLKP